MFEGEDILTKAFVSKNGSARVKVVVQTKASSFRWEVMEEEVKFWLTSSPHRGKANKELIRGISRICKVPMSRIKIVGGERSRVKIIEINGMTPQIAGEYFMRF